MFYRLLYMGCLCALSPYFSGPCQEFVAIDILVRKVYLFKGSAVRTHESHATLICFLVSVGSGSCVLKLKVPELLRRPWTETVQLRDWQL